MAISRFSQPAQLLQPTDNINAELLDQTLGYKQAKYDEGYLNIQKGIQAIGALDLIKPEDIEYRNKKLAQLTDQLNQYGNIDLSDPKVSTKLQLEAENVTKDPTLLGMLTNTADYRRVIKRYDLMKENPKLMPFYSPQNEWMDKQRLSKWLRGESPVVGISSPTLYTDADKITGDAMKQLAPKSMSTVNKIFIVDSKLRTHKDLQYIALEKANSNPQVAQQLAINAQYAYKDVPPSMIYEEALKISGDDIAETKESLLQYENQLKTTTITKEQKADIEAKISELKDGKNPDGTLRPGLISQAEQQRNKIAEEYRSGKLSNTDSLKQQLYTANWSKGVARPYIVDEQKSRPNPYGVIEANAINTDNRELMKMKFESGQNDLDRKAKIDSDILHVKAQLYKDGGGELDEDLYRQTGTVAIKGGIGSGNYTTMPTTAPEIDTDHDNIREINTKIDQYKLENKQLLGQATIELLKETDRSLLAKVKPVLEAGGKVGDKGKQLGLSDAQVRMFAQYDQMLDDATDYNKITSNPTLAKYAGYQNAMTTNMMRWEALETERDKAERDVFNDLWKSGKYKGTWNTYQQEIKGKQNKRVATFDPVTGGYTYGSTALTPGQEHTKMINSKLANSPMRLKFYTAKVINAGDAVYNSDKGKSGLIRTFAETNGVIIDNQTSSINGVIENGVSVRDNVDNVEKIQVNKIIPNTNTVEVSLFYKKDPEDKQLIEKRGVKMILNPTQMKELEGRSSENEAPMDILSSLKNGEMVDKTGAPRYYNLAGDVPGMVGNLQYRFFNMDRDELLLSIKIPTIDGTTEIHIPERIAKFSGEKADEQGKQFLIRSYNQFYNITKAKNEGKSDEEISKLTLKTFYDTFK